VESLCIDAMCKMCNVLNRDVPYGINVIINNVLWHPQFIVFGNVPSSTCSQGAENCDKQKLAENLITRY
jgi:hypothetical protein